jgi:phosphotransferase system  glucose/maltose/N-acetylglucosamine-specific IIC component
MSKFKEVGSFILGLIFIIGGFLSFVSIPVITQQDIDISFNFLIVLGCILIILGIISMYFFIKTEDKKKKKAPEDKKKKSPNNNPPNDIDVV